MVQALPKRWKKNEDSSSISDEIVGANFGSFSVDNELVTSENILLSTKQYVGVERQKRWTQGSDAAGSYTLMAGQVITFRGLADSVIGITEGDLRDDEIDEGHDRNLVVKTTRRVIFSKKISSNPANMRRLQPRIILDDIPRTFIAGIC